MIQANKIPRYCVKVTPTVTLIMETIPEVQGKKLKKVVNPESGYDRVLYPAKMVSDNKIQMGTRNC